MLTKIDIPDDPIARAKSYPYAAPDRSYLYVNGGVYEIVAMGTDPTSDGTLATPLGARPAGEVLRDLGVDATPGLDERVPVIAHGSNHSPEQLARKFAHVADDVVIPVIKARLADHDVVYAPHFTAYGSIPATLARAPGTAVELSVTFLTVPQLVMMHETEIAAVNYVYGRLSGIALALDGLAPIEAAFAYLTRHGNLALGGAPLALAARVASGRSFAGLAMAAMLERARDHTAPGRPLDAFILENIADPSLRAERTAALREHAQAADFSSFEVIDE